MQTSNGVPIYGFTSVNNIMRLLNGGMTFSNANLITLKRVAKDGR